MKLVPQWKQDGKNGRNDDYTFYVDSALRTTFSALCAQIKNKINKDWERENHQKK